MKLRPLRLAITLLFLTAATSAQAELLWRVGYITQSLSSEEGYNQFLSERYGASNVLLSGPMSAATYRKNARVGLGLEYSVLSGKIRYTTLNGEPQENQLVLASSIFLLTAYRGAWEWTAGYGVNQLTRTFYGYQDADIVTSNIEEQEDTQTSVTTSTTTLFQGLYLLMEGKRLQWSAGARYTLNRHEIPASDIRPGYDSRGVPTDQTFDLGGLGLMTTLTYRF